MTKAVRTRFAPSPTGLLHIGNARTALFNWLFARSEGGDFILRIEDTDPVRSSREFERAIIEDLRWLGLDWDEGVDLGGARGPYRQSERLQIYTDEAQRLLRAGKAYRCWCARERLEGLRESQIRAGRPPKYDGRCLGLKDAPAPGGAPPSIRFRVPQDSPGTISFEDGVHGRVSFSADTIGDFIIMGSDGVASYNFAVAVDDALMAITRVIRGDDHISNTPRQLLIFEALGFKAPAFAHIPLVLAPDRTPLSKRESASSLRALKEGGYLPEAILNAAARLGWSLGEGLLTPNEMAGEFSMENLSASPSVFDVDRLRSFNKLLMERTDSKELVRLAGIEWDDAAALEKAAHAVKPNAATLSELKALLAPFAGESFDLTPEAQAALDQPHAEAVIGAFIRAFENADRLDEPVYNGAAMSAKEATGEKGRRLFLPLRCALTGSVAGIELVKVVELLGRDRVIQRLKNILKRYRS